MQVDREGRSTTPRVEVVGIDGALATSALTHRVSLGGTVAAEIEYSSGRTPSGEWFAIGSVYVRPTPRLHPAWIVVGYGANAAAAVADLRQQVDERVLMAR